MNKVNDIINELYAQIKDEVSYPVYLGVRDSITKFPVIIIEPMNVIEGEEGEACYGKIDVEIGVNVYGYIQAYSKDKQIVGDSREVGILDLAREIKLAIDEDRTIGGKAIHTRINETVFGIVDYPIREVLVNISIMARQIEGVR